MAQAIGILVCLYAITQARSPLGLILLLACTWYWCTYGTAPLAWLFH